MQAHRLALHLLRLLPIRLLLTTLFLLGLFTVVDRPPSVYAQPTCTTDCYVNGTAGDDNNDGASPATPLQTIQAAVNQVSPDGTVIVADGTYVENVSIAKNLTLSSVNGRDATTIQGISGVSAMGTVWISGGTSAVTIGGLSGEESRGFTIIGIDNGAPGLENAAVYFQGNHSGAAVIGNDIVANGDAGFLTEFSAIISGFTIDSNIFSGQTFEGGNPEGNGFGDQFSAPNRPRQLVTNSGGGGGGNTSDITFTNNQSTGIAGGLNPSDQEQGNTLVTIDSVGATISGNTFSGTTTRSPDISMSRTTPRASTK